MAHRLTRLRRLLAPAVLVGLVAMSLAVPGSAAAAGDGDGMPDVDTTATSTYVAVPSKGVVDVTVTQRLTNRIPSSTEAYSCIQYTWDPYWGLTPYASTCYRTTNYYINEGVLWVEREATNVKVTTNGGSVTLARGTSTANYRSYKLTFAHTFEGKSRTLTATYVIPGGKPRSAGASRINRAYLDFVATAQFADTSNVRVEIPKAYDASTFGSAAKRSTSGTTTVFIGSDVDPTEFYLGVQGTNLAGFSKQNVSDGRDRTISIQGWPDDPAWMSAVKGEVQASFARIENLIGQPLPGTGPIVIREVSDSELGDAYIGVFDPKAQMARISEDFTQAGTVTHELSHAWFNSSLFGATWMSEGYAQWMERAAGANSTPCLVPATFPGTGQPNLGLWTYASPKATDAELDLVDYQYDAACWIVSKVASDIDDDGMRAVLAVLATANGAYAGVPDTVVDAPVDWKAWLDAVDEQGMAPAGLDDTHTVADLLVRFGIASEAALTGRAAARTDLDAMRSQPDGWAVPAAVIRPMAAWDFQTAEAAMTEIATIRATLAQVEASLPGVNGTTNPIRTSVEAATDLSMIVDANGRATAQLAAAKDVATAQAEAAAATGPLEQVGLAGTDVPSMEAAARDHVRTFDLDTATAEARTIELLVAGAAGVGAMRVGGIVGVAVLLLLMVAFVVARRRRRRGLGGAAMGDVSPDDGMALPVDEMPTIATVIATAHVTAAAVVGPMADAAPSPPDASIGPPTRTVGWR